MGCLQQVANSLGFVVDGRVLPRAEVFWHMCQGLSTPTQGILGDCSGSPAVAQWWPIVSKPVITHLAMVSWLFECSCCSQYHGSHGPWGHSPRLHPPPKRLVATHFLQYAGVPPTTSRLILYIHGRQGRLEEGILRAGMWQRTRASCLSEVTPQCSFLQINLLIFVRILKVILAKLRANQKGYADYKLR